MISLESTSQTDWYDSLHNVLELIAFILLIMNWREENQEIFSEICQLL